MATFRYNSVVLVGVMSTLGLLALLRDPEPSATGRWASLSHRGRGWVRLFAGAVFLGALAAVSIGASAVLGTHFITSFWGRLVMNFLVPSMGFGGIYLIGWGALSILTGKGHDQISPVPRLLFLVIVAVLSFPILIGAMTAGGWAPDVLSSQWVLSFTSGYAEIRTEVELIDSLRTSEDCEEGKVLRKSIERIEALIEANPKLARFEIEIDRPDTPTTHERTLYNWMIVRHIKESSKLRCEHYFS